MELDSQAGGMVYISPIANGAPAFAAVYAPKFGHNEDCLRPKWTHVAQFLDSQYHQMDSHTSEKNALKKISFTILYGGFLLSNSKCGIRKNYYLFVN